MTFVGLKFGQDLEDLRHTPIKNSQEYPPGSDPPPPKKKRRNVGRITQNELRVVSCDQAAVGTNI